MNKYLIKGVPVSETTFRVAIGARADETTHAAIERVAAEYKHRTGRHGPLRNTCDDDMTFAELIGLPDLDDDPAIQIVVAGIPTGSASTRYTARQLQKHEAAQQKAEADKKRGQRDETKALEDAEAAAWEYKKVNKCTKTRAAQVIAKRMGVKESSLIDRMKPYRQKNRHE